MFNMITNQFFSDKVILHVVRIDSNIESTSIVTHDNYFFGIEARFSKIFIQHYYLKDTRNSLEPFRRVMGSSPRKQHTVFPYENGSSLSLQYNTAFWHIGALVPRAK